MPSDTQIPGEGERLNAAEPERLPMLPPGLPDDWALDRDLPCPKCRYNLRMLRTPRCPECGTIFRWQALLAITCPRCAEPLESVHADKCPRCELSLDWQRLLESADPGQLKRYEYTSRPVAAAIKTVFGVLRPRRFWAGIRIESQPALQRLRRLRYFAVGIFVLGLSLAAVANRAAAASFIGWGPVYTIAGTALVLPLLTAVALPRFTPTLARFRVRRDQLLRCSGYGCCNLVWVGVVLALVSVVAEIVNILGLVTGPRWRAPMGLYFDPVVFLGALFSFRFGFRPWAGNELLWFNSVVGVLLIVVCFFWWWRFLYVSLRHYLQLDRGNAVALFLSTQLVGLLVLALVLMRSERMLRLIGGWLAQF